MSSASAYTVPKNNAYIQPANPQPLDDAFLTYANPDSSSVKCVTLIRPSIIFSKNSYSTPLAMPIGIAYLAAVLEKAAYKVKIVDVPGRGVERVSPNDDGRFNVLGLSDDDTLNLIDPNSDIIGVSIMFSQEWPHQRKFINKVRQRFPHARIVVGGEHATAMPAYSLQDCPAIDYLIKGEGELTLLELVYKLRAEKSVDDIRGICYLKDGQLQDNGLSARMADIKLMPWPAWHLIDVEPYFRPNFTMGIGQGRNMAMVATRGCPYQCTFCSNPTMWTTRYAMRPVECVVSEIEENIRRYQVNSIDFYDLTAIVQKKWILDFTAEIRRRKLDIVWQLPSGTRSECLDEEVISGLSQAGCKFLVYAPESGSKRTLEMIKKRINLDNMVVSIKTALQQKIVVKVNFIIGFPFETRKDIFETLAFTWRLALLGVDDCNVSCFTPYPGSELFNELNSESVFGTIDDAYFENLITQFDFTFAKTFCRHVSSVELLLYRVIGMAIFYILSYLSVPSRSLRLLRCLTDTTVFQPGSLFEQRIFDAVSRFRAPSLISASGKMKQSPSK